MREKLTGAVSIPRPWIETPLHVRAAKSRASEDDLSRDLSRPASTDSITLAEAGANGTGAATEDMSVEGVKGLQAKFEVG